MLASRHAHFHAERFNETITLYFVTLELSHTSIVLSCLSCSLTSRAVQMVFLICDVCRLCLGMLCSGRKGKLSAKSHCGCVYYLVEPEGCNAVPYLFPNTQPNTAVLSFMRDFVWHSVI